MKHTIILLLFSCALWGQKKDTLAFKRFIESRVSSINTLISLEISNKNKFTNPGEVKSLDKTDALLELRNMHLNNKSLSECFYLSFSKAYNMLGTENASTYFIERMSYNGETNHLSIYCSDQKFIRDGSCGNLNFKIKQINDSIISQCKDDGTVQYNDWFVITKITSTGLSYNFYVQPNTFMRQYFKD